MTKHRLLHLRFVGLGLVLGVAATLAAVIIPNTFTRVDPNKEDHPLHFTVENIEPTNEVSSETLSSDNHKQHYGLLQFLVEAPSVFERTQALNNLILSADELLLTRLLSQSEGIQSADLQHKTQTLIVQRFAFINAELALTTIQGMRNERQTPLISTLFGEWSHIDLTNAVARAANLDLPKKMSAFQGILATQNALSSDERVRIAHQLELDPDIVEQESKPKTTSQLWQELLFDEEPNFAQSTQLIRLAHKWVADNGLTAVEQIDSSNLDPLLKQMVLGSIFQRAMLADPSTTLQQVISYQGELRSLALESIAKIWINVDPEAALSLIALIDSPRLQRELREKYVTAWVVADPEEVLTNIQLVPESLRSFTEVLAIRQLAQYQPTVALQFLTNVSEEWVRLNLSMEIATHWASQDAIAALDWLLKEDTFGYSARSSMLTTILRELTEENSELAFRTALEQPLDKLGFGLEHIVVEEIAQTDLETAFDMLSQVRDGWTQSSSYIAVGKALVRNGETERALQLAQDLQNEEHKDLYYSLIVNEWAYTEPKSLVNELDGLPSSEAKYVAAMDLVRMNAGTNVLSKDQLSYVKDFLPKDYNPETGRRGSESERFSRLNDLENVVWIEGGRVQLQKDVRKLMIQGRHRIGSRR